MSEVANAPAVADIDAVQDLSDAEVAELTASSLPEFGYLRFDDPKAPGAGWACRAGADPVRVVTPSELSTSAVWLTNVGDMFWKSGFHRNPWLKNDRYLRVKIAGLVDEWGIGDASPDDQAAFIADIFSRIMTATKALVPAFEVKEQMLRDDFAVAHSAAEMPPESGGATAVALRKALADASQDYTFVPRPFVKDTISVRLTRPRVEHLEEVLDHPIPGGPWKLVKASSMGSDPIAWLEASKRPVIAKVVIEGESGSLVEALDLAGFGTGARDRKGRGKRRSWVTGPELALLSDHFQVRVEAAWLGADWRPSMADTAVVDQAVLKHYRGRLGALSWTAGIVLENLWCGGLKVDGAATGDDRAQSFRSVWLRALDRVSLYPQAHHLVNAGFSVTGYGFGQIFVSVGMERLEELVVAAYSQGLEISVTAARALAAHLNDMGQGCLSLDPQTWPGRIETGVAAMLRGAGEQQMLLDLDGIIEGTPAEGEARLNAILGG